jgi:Cell division septal protein
VVLTTSPILSLRSVKVEGTERLTSEAVVDALQPFTGEPLARVSPDDVIGALSDIALIQSIETRLELPGTLVVTITERTPIGAIQQGGGFQVVDRAAVVLFESETRPTEFPLIGVVPNPESRGFQAIGEALAVIPPEVLARIDRVSASSADTVAFSLRDSNHQVLWGSSESSGEKARVLPAALRTAGDTTPQLIDLSTPDTVVIRDVDNPLPTPQAPEVAPDEAELPDGESSETNGDTP